VVQVYVPALPLPVLIVGAIGFAIVNATLEEIVWRGAIQDGLEPLFGATGAIALQAVSFGVQHLHGVPRGASGILLAGTWAVMLGLLRRHARGLLAPILAHVVADATIAIIILTYAAN
jgi:membrane protease YdiL (CAAX protease family)